MAFLEITAAIGALTIGFKTIKRDQKKRLIDTLVDDVENEATVAPIYQRTLVKLQTLKAVGGFLLNDADRNEQLQMLSATENAVEISDVEREADQDMSIALTSLGIATAGTLIYAPLLLASLPGLIYLSWKRYKALYHSLFKQRRVTMDLIDAVCVIGVFGGGFFVVGSFMFYLSALGRKILDRTKAKSRQRLVNVFGEQPKKVWILVDDVETETPLEQLQEGDIVVARAGQAIPIDGTIIRGIGSIDQRFLTGEAQPAEKGIGDSVYAATTLLSGQLYIQTETSGADTYVAQIGEILRHTADLKLDLQSTGEAFADKTVLPTILCSGLSLPFLGLNGALAIIWASLGWSLRITVPMSLMNFLSILSRNNILVKDARALETLNEVDTVVFDKTGTLTLEQPSVGEIYTCSEFSGDELLRYAAIAEEKQAHPIAKAIQTEAAARNINVQAFDDVHYEIGYGIRVRLGRQMIRVGSERFMKMEAIAVPAGIQAQQRQCNAQGNSLVMVGVDDKLAGAIELNATIRPEAKSIVQELQQRNLSIFIISGDHEQPTEKLAKELGIDGYFANTLPTDKAKLVEELQKAGRSVCFIGDGINDSIALEKADVSISLLGATTVATDMAQIILMDSNLEKLNYLFDIAEDLQDNMKNNMKLSILPGIICIGGAFFLHFGFAVAMLIGFTGVFAGIGNTMVPLYKWLEVDQRSI